MEIQSSKNLEEKSSAEEEMLKTDHDNSNLLINNDTDPNFSWSGEIDMPQVGRRLQIKAHQVFGCVENMADIKNKITISDTISNKTLFGDLEQVGESNANKEMALVSLLPNSKSEFSNYMTIYNYFKGHNTVGVVEGLGKMVKTCYIFPLSQEELIHPVLLAMTLDGPELDDDQDELLWALIIRNRKTQPIPDTDHECDFRGKILTNRSNLKKHIRLFHSHGVQKDFKCKSCDKSFSFAGNLKQHFERVHEGKRNHKCNRCGKTFFSRSSTKKHIDTVHDGKRNYKCNECGKSFSSSGNLNIHIRSVHEGRRDYECTECRKFFSSSSNLNLHIRSVHEGRKDYKCKECGKLFSMPGNLKKHLRSIHAVHS